MAKLIDKFGRIHDYIRISLTDKCNLNCTYCNPDTHNYKKLGKNDILNYDELIRLIKIFLVDFEVRKIRFTGGEPLVRKDIITFFEKLYDIKRSYNFEFCLTTNGTLLENKISRLRELGLDKLNISIDSLNAEKYKQITGKDVIKSVKHSIDMAEELKFDGLKINVVLIKGINDGEILDFVDFVRDRKITLRFIEYMPFGCNGWSKDKFISSGELKRMIEKKYKLIKINDSKLRVASNYNIEGYTGRIGFISSISNNFCGSCNRIRIKSDGNMKSCLFSDESGEINLKKYIRDPLCSDSYIARLIYERVQLKEKGHLGVDDIIKLDKNKMIDVGG